MLLISSMLIMSILITTGAYAGTVENTRYGQSGLRLEVRPDPLGMPEGITFETLEKAFADGGIGARWISVVDPLGCPYYESKFLPTNITDLDKREAELKKWVKTIHDQGLPVVSWYPLIICKSARDAKPEWRQHYLVEGPDGKHRDIECCFNTGYGQALIDFCNEAIDKFDLDGIWFDGSAWTQIWDRPLPLSCSCPDCKRLFKEQTSFELPQKVNWDDPVFRRWVAWRYESFGDYIGKLAEGIRKKHPNAVVVINHYHRPQIPWQGAIPLNPYKADIITGSEATGEDRADLTMRLCRAYGRPQSEVWRPFDYGKDPATSGQTDELIHHALTCITAGGMPCYGTSPDPIGVSGSAKYVSSVMNAVRPYIGDRSVPYAAIHLSQQSETFFFSRAPKGQDWALESYWKSVMGWTQGLMQGHIAPDYIYDKDLVPENIRKYKLLIMPMSQALSDEQCKTVLEFANKGGVVLLGPASGAFDEWGEKRKASLFEQGLSFEYAKLITPACDQVESVKFTYPNGKQISTFAAIHTPFYLKVPEWEGLFRSAAGAYSDHAVAVRPYGRGKVIVCSLDLGGASVGGWMPVTGGETSIAVTDETAAKGNRSLKFVDGPDAPQSFYPDMEIRFQPFGPPDKTIGQLVCDLKLSKDSQVCIEGRHSAPKLGPSVHIGRDGKLWAQDKPLCNIPPDTWFTLIIRFRLTGPHQTYDVTVRLPDSEPKEFFDLPYIDKDFNMCDWFVIFGEGTAKSTFYVDNLLIRAINLAHNEESSTVMQDDFEATPVGQVVPQSPLIDVAQKLVEIAPAPVQVEAPDYVRMGAYYTKKSEVVVHLHNLQGKRTAVDGPSAIISTRFPVISASLALSGQKLEVQRGSYGCTITVPKVPLHEVVVITPAVL